MDAMPIQRCVAAIDTGIISDAFDCEATGLTRAHPLELNKYFLLKIVIQFFLNFTINIVDITEIVKFNN